MVEFQKMRSTVSHASSSSAHGPAKRPCGTSVSSSKRAAQPATTVCEPSLGSQVTTGPTSKSSPKQDPLAALPALGRHVGPVQLFPSRLEALHRPTHRFADRPIRRCRQ